MYRLASQYTSLGIWVLLITLPLKVTYAVSLPRALFAQTADAQDQENSSTQIWRFTKQGWTDLSKLDRPEPVRIERRIELVHPLLFSIFVVLVSGGFLIWSSEEWHWAQLTGRRVRK